MSAVKANEEAALQTASDMVLNARNVLGNAYLLLEGSGIKDYRDCLEDAMMYTDYALHCLGRFELVGDPWKEGE